LFGAALFMSSSGRMRLAHIHPMHPYKDDIRQQVLLQFASGELLH